VFIAKMNKQVEKEVMIVAMSPGKTIGAHLLHDFRSFQL